MTATAHAIVAGAIASVVNNPVLGITLATMSHPLLDMVPHWDAGCGWRQKTKLRLFTEGTIDLVAGFGLAFLLFYNSNINIWYFLACLIGSVGWDVAEIPYWFWNWKFPPFGWIYQFQSKIQGRATMIPGILTQVVTIALVIVFTRFVV